MNIKKKEMDYYKKSKIKVVYCNLNYLMVKMMIKLQRYKKQKVTILNLELYLINYGDLY